MDEQPSRKRRIAMRAALLAAVGTLLFSVYVEGYFALWWGLGRGTIRYSTYTQLEETVYAPLVCYIDDRHPGSDTAVRFRSWLWFRARGTPVEWNKVSGDQ